MKKIFTFFALFVSIALHLQAQVSISPSPYPSPMVQNTIAVNSKSNNNVKGTPYSDNEYRHGELWTSQNYHFAKTLLYRFNETNNTVEIKDAEGNIAFVKAEVIDSFHIQTSNQTAIRYYKGSLLNSPSLKNNLVQLVYTGKNVTIYKVPYKYQREKPFNGYIGDAHTLYEFVRRDEYYIKNGSKPIQPLSLTKKDILKKIPSKRSALIEEYDYIEFYETITEQKLIDLLTKTKA